MQFNKDIILEGFKNLYTRNNRRFTKQHAINLNFLIKSFSEDPILADMSYAIPKISYMLATVLHETAWTLAPIKEYRAAEGTPLRKNQDRYWTPFHGRGYVQLTWGANYKKAQDILGVGLVENPDLALKPSIAYKIMISGMLGGWFTGKKLSDYINDNGINFVEARRIINKLDKASQIANYAKTIMTTLNTALIGQPMDKEIEVATELPSEEVPTIEPDTTTFTDKTEDWEITTNVSEPVSEKDLIVETIEKHLPKVTSGIKTWKATLLTVLGGIFTAITGFLGWINERAHDPSSAKVLLIISGSMLALIAIVIITFIIIKNINVRAREREAHEETMLELRIRANPALKNVEIQK